MCSSLEQILCSQSNAWNVYNITFELSYLVLLWCKSVSIAPSSPFSFSLPSDIAVRLDYDDSMLVKTQVTSRFPRSNSMPSKTNCMGQFVSVL
jgi:hypothetical protein